jgi:hypothetical protein
MDALPVDLPFSLPPTLDPGLARVYDYWFGLRRGQADIPFADDVKLGALSDTTVDSILVDVFERPLRFRIALAGSGIARRYGSPIEGIFADEFTPQAPLDYFLSQCSASVEGRAPNFYRNARRPVYARLLLPLWGDGHINALLGAVAYGTM